MTMRITMLSTRMGESGSLLTVAGSPYTVSNAFGTAMIGAGYATDTDGIYRAPLVGGPQPVRYDPATGSLVDAAGIPITGGTVSGVLYNGPGGKLSNYTIGSTSYVVAYPDSTHVTVTGGGKIITVTLDGSTRLIGKVVA